MNIVFSKQHQHTFKNDEPIQVSCLFTFALNSSNENKAERKMFSAVDCWCP